MTEAALPACPESKGIHEKMDALAEEVHGISQTLNLVSDKVDRNTADHAGLKSVVIDMDTRMTKSFKKGMLRMHDTDERVNDLKSRVDNMESGYESALKAQSEAIQCLTNTMQQTHELVVQVDGRLVNVEEQTKPIIKERADRDGFWATLKDWKWKVGLLGFVAGAVLLIYSLWGKINGAGQP